MQRWSILAAALLASAPTPEPMPPAGQESSDPALEVVAPVYPNPACPIMGKPISTRLFVDTEFGRIYVCCKGCNKKILADVATAYKTAYPRTKKLDNRVCPVSGRRIAEEGASSVLLQGQEIALCCVGCVKGAQERPQSALAKANRPALVDLENATCPVTGEPTVKDVFVLIGDRLVRLSSPECIDEVRKAPKPALDRALAARGTAKPEGNGAPEAPAAPGKKGG